MLNITYDSKNNYEGKLDISRLIKAKGYVFNGHTFKHTPRLRELHNLNIYLLVFC